MNENEDMDLEEEDEERIQKDMLLAEFGRLQAKIEQLEAQRDEARAETLRGLAETQTVRRRGQDELRRQREMANERLITEMLPVLDNFERTLAHLEEGVTVEALKGGIGAVERQLRSVLEGAGVRRVVSIGEPFDPMVHDALGTEVSEDQPEDTVVFEFEPAYKMGEKVIRHARVKVAKPA